MKINKIIKNYLQALEEGNTGRIMEMFSKEGVVHSPLSGKVKASKFYRNLFKETEKSEITLLNVFESKNNNLMGAGHFIYNWELKNGEKTEFECIDIFKFSKNRKIEQLKIIYDTYETRKAYDSE